MGAQAQAQLRTAEVIRGYVTIVAPSAGYVVKRLVAPGVLVQPGMAILKTAQIDKVRLQANVGEKDLASIKVGSPVAVTTTGTGQPPIVARVTSVFPFVDAGARTAVVEALVENTGRRFLPGQYVMMEFVTGERAEALSVPRGAVARLGGKSTVWVVKDGRAEPMEVATGLENPERIEVMKGLAGGEQVIARGHEGLYAGARVSDVSGAKPARQDGADPRKGMPGMSEQGGAAKPETPVKPADPHKGM
jgi:RND family efflux transporter MFP subunit